VVLEMHLVAVVVAEEEEQQDPVEMVEQAEPDQQDLHLDYQVQSAETLLQILGQVAVVVEVVAVILPPEPLGRLVVMAALGK
jgi:hypothetical protein